MPFPVVLDACVLYPFTVRDVLLRAAEIDLISPVWSDEILDEMTRNLVERGAMDDVRAQALRSALEDAFPEALVLPPRITALLPAMTNDPKDRHVVATAVAYGAELIATSNLKDFPTAALQPHGVRAIDPQQLARMLLAGWPGDMLEALHAQAHDLNTVRDIDHLLEFLAKTMPEFAADARLLLAD